MYLDCAGFRTLAVCDLISGETNITKGELKGRRFPDLASDDTGAEFWAFVDLSTSSKSIYILAAEDVAEGISRATDAWVARDPRRERKGHHAIELERVAHGKNRWDLLGLPR
ncbi:MULTISPECIES: hypothetical protein [unclassified Rhodococcus (in: high G+C Gram-positive bacteria)]|uniref:hypothetical protein n=1 Tax=unclassified Rhodococcus (in: high G+C Gram-positive bacteria) TaxID=192944 RepID=UPI00163A2552|nr:MULTISPECIES: hypothetical protein [unclassified Rhodococcus (in: high G+C Gram-positive bacteria)]MBC2639083.1 hypothetical protein [Rhodococcus sp. 3A]MBC2896175.1 hypothetical protein [Rhodococcus sp. 4CII]